MRRCALGERAALRQLYDATSAKLFGVCLRILSDRQEAEDVLQETYLAVWTKAAGFDPGKASPITWLVAIAPSPAIDRLRAAAMRRGSDPIEAADGIGDSSPSAALLLEEAG